MREDLENNFKRRKTQMENNEIMVNEGTMEACDMVSTGPSPKAVLGIALGLTALTGLGIFLAVKIKKGADARRIKALEKKGYMVIKPESEETVDDCEE